MTQYPESNPAKGATRSRQGQTASTVGSWELVRPVSMGAMTSTFAARPSGTQLPSRYIIKVPSEETGNPTLATCLLNREAIVGRKVCHPHLITVLDANVHQSPYYLVTPLLPGHTLREYLDSPRCLDLNFVLWIARQIAEGLSALHSQHWLHSDVKPENILVAPDGHVTLLDLGFARQMNDAKQATDPVVMGTCNYMAPEVSNPTGGVGPSSDLYSLAVVMYETITGQLPFTGRDADELASRHRLQRPHCIRDLVPATPSAVASLIHGMLAKQPADRIQAADEVISKLIRLEIETFARRKIA